MGRRRASRDGNTLVGHVQQRRGRGGGRRRIAATAVSHSVGVLLVLLMPSRLLMLPSHLLTYLMPLLSHLLLLQSHLLLLMSHRLTHLLSLMSHLLLLLPHQLSHLLSHLLYTLSADILNWLPPLPPLLLLATPLLPLPSGGGRWDGLLSRRWDDGM